MKTRIVLPYESPRIEVVKVFVEYGFAATTGGDGQGVMPGEGVWN